MNNYVTGVSPPVAGTSAATSPKPAGEHAQEVLVQEKRERTQVPLVARATEKQEVKVQEQVSLDELAESLQRINMTFDLFEIEAKFSISEESNQVRVELRNTRTGKVIRRIPPYEFTANFASFKDGVGLLVNQLF